MVTIIRGGVYAVKCCIQCYNTHLQKRTHGRQCVDWEEELLVDYRRYFLVNVPTTRALRRKVQRTTFRTSRKAINTESVVLQDPSTGAAEAVSDGTAHAYYQWSALLRALSSFEAYT